jgi:hypothetical protein
MICPNWSTARYMYRHWPPTFTYVVDEPAVPETVPARPRCVGQQRGEAPPAAVDADVIRLDAAFGQ